MSTIECPCGKTATFVNKNAGCTDVGAVMRATSFKPLFGNDGGMGWLCPACHAAAQAHAVAIREILHGFDTPYELFLPRENSK